MSTTTIITPLPSTPLDPTYKVPTPFQVWAEGPVDPKGRPSLDHETSDFGSPWLRGPEDRYLPGVTTGPNRVGMRWRCPHCGQWNADGNVARRGSAGHIRVTRPGRGFNVYYCWDRTRCQDPNNPV
jgi:hypothetical protein